MKMSHLVFFSLEKRKETREKKTTREVKWKTRYERQVMRERGGRRKQMAKRGKEKGELEREKRGEERRGIGVRRKMEITTTTFQVIFLNNTLSTKH